MDKAKKVTSGKKKVGKFVVDNSHKLGSGTFGEVFSAENQQTKQIVAVKIIKKEQISQDSYQKAALIRQIQIMKHLKSPNIIQFIQISQTSSNIYIFQELANEGTLQNILDQCHRFTQKVALTYIVQILNGFSQLVKHGIIHRDIKSSNILVKDKVIKLADFGMSRYSGKTSFMISYVGTPFYMAPQILKQGPYSYKCDIWSLGVLFYELVTGCMPWKVTKESGVKELSNLIQEKCKTGIQFPNGLDISPLYKDLVCGCLKYEEADRFDWQQIFSHKIFDGKFAKTVHGNENFTLTQIRLKAHSNNLNLEKMISKLPDKLTKSDFLNVVKAISGQITAKDSDDLFKIISESKQTLELAKMKKYLQDHGIKLSGLKAKAEVKQESEKKMDELLQKLSKSIQQKEIDLFDLYKQFDKKKQNRLEKSQFQELILSICSDFSKQNIDDIFYQFNGKQDKTYILFESLYENICKAAQIPAYKDEKLSKQIKKLVEKKKEQ